MGTSGMFALADALNNLVQIHVRTQLLVGDATVSTASNYLTLVMDWSNKLSVDQQKCSADTENSTAGNTTYAIKAAKWHGIYQSDSTEMNKDIGRQNALMNTEEMQMHIQAENLTPVYSVLEYVSLLFLTTSGLITR